MMKEGMSLVWVFLMVGVLPALGGNDRDIWCQEVYENPGNAKAMEKFLESWGNWQINDELRLWLIGKAETKNDAAAWRILATYFEKTGFRKHAEGCLDRVVAFDESDRGARSARARLRIQNYNYAGALEDFEKLEAGGEPVIPVKLGVVEASMKWRHSELLRLCSELAETRPADAAAKYVERVFVALREVESVERA